MGNLYSKLALTSIKKNRVFYVPYIISAAIMVALFFIVAALTMDPYIQKIHGGETLTSLLMMGIPVLALLSILFLFVDVPPAADALYLWCVHPEAS